MKVLLVSTSFPVVEASVSGIFVARLADALVTHEGIHVEVLAPGSDQRPQRYRNGIRVHTFGYAFRRWQRLAHEPGGLPVSLRRSPWLWALVPPFLASFLIACLRHGRRAQVLHANWAPSGLVAGLAAWLLRKPLVTTVRGEDATRLAQSRLQHWIMRGCIALSDQVVTVSESIALELSARFPAYRDRIQTIPNGVESHPRANNLRGGARFPFHIAVVGSLVSRKRVDCAIRAVALLPAALKESVRLSIIGAGPESDSLDSLTVSLCIAPQVELLGRVDPDEVLRQLSTCHAMAICSESEGRPNAVLEAMATGLPILGTSIPGVEELVRHGSEGLLFSPGDVPKLAAHMEALMVDESLRKSLADGARKRISDLGLSWGRCANQYAAVYYDVLTGNT
ncbi:MAG: glycosyltransferase family 4 protein [Rhodanobacteraceae bacterium]|nr:glycosyltransferase family 4 protein [Rhodanobacteraceae bacterium]